MPPKPSIVRTQRVPAWVLIASVVVLAHLAVLLAVRPGQTRLQHPQAPLEIRVLPAPVMAAPDLPPARKPVPEVAPQRRKPVAQTLPEPASLSPTPAALVAPAPGAVEAKATATRTEHSSPSTAAATSSALAPARTPTTELIQPPSSKASYLNNPQPPYPAISRRLGEQGRVVVRVLISAQGHAKQVDIGQSSGSARLDQAALDTVMTWRFVPGRRAGVAEDMWYQVPISFSID